MKKVKILIFPLLLVICSCGNTETDHKTNQDGDASIDSISSPVTSKIYPREIDSLGISDIYDETKWFLYCIYCDDTIKFWKRPDLPDTLTFGQVELKYKDLVVQNDTLQPRFEFYYRGIRCNGEQIHRVMTWGMRFKKGAKEPIGFTSESGWERIYNPKTATKSRYTEPLQPEVINYLKAHKTSADPWFLKEAQKREVID